MLRTSGILNLLVFIIIAQTAFTQPRPIRFQHLSVEQGLSHNQVYSFTQDKHGFIWIATNDGLNRFDGNKVEIFRYKQGDKNSIPSNGILCLFTDSRGIVWTGTSMGLAYYDEHINSFRSIPYNPKDKNSLPNDVINVINEDNRGVLWIGTPQGLFSFDVKKNRFQRFVQPTRDIKFAPDGAMWIATPTGLKRFDLSTMTFTTFLYDATDTTTPSGNNPGNIAIDKDGNLWMFQSNTRQLDCFNTNTFRCKRFKNFIEKQSAIATNYLLSLFIDRSGRLWVGTSQSGLCIFYPEKNLFYQYKIDPFDPGGLRSNTIIKMYQDRSGMIWLGTFANGVEWFNPDESKFMLHHFLSLQSWSPGYKSVQAVAEDSSGRLWIGTSDGLSVFDRNTGAVTDYKWNQHDPHSLSVDFVQSICRDQQGNMWIGTMSGLNLFDPLHHNFRAFYAEDNDHSLAGNNVRNIICDKNGDLLIASRPGGLTIYHSKTQQFSNFKNNSMHALLNDNIHMNVVFEDNRGVLWIGMRKGLIRFDRNTRKLEHFITDPDDTTSLPAKYICSIAQDHKGVIWIGTASGLCRFNEKTRTFTTFSEKNGLPNERVMQLLVDDKDRIWMGTNRGISMLNESRTAFTNYDPSDGLQGWEFSEPSAFKTHDGYFCYGGQYGFNMFRPDSIKKNPFIPPIVLKGITIFDQPLNIDSSYASLKTLKLSHKQNFFSFEFAALNYDHPEKNQYACQLIPFDKQMRQLGTNHSISYTNVPPGNYMLKVMASNNDGVWNEAGYGLELIIVPPFWATMWFRTIVIILFIGLVFLFFKLRENRIRKEQVRQTAFNKQIAELRMTALQTQMNPHFIFNSLNSIQQLISIREKEEAINYLSKFSKLIRRILENSQENTVSISNELELLELYMQLEQLRFSHKFDYHIAVGDKIDRDNTEIPPLLIQPYVENAILHGLVNKNGKGDLWLSLDRNNGLLVCKIEDNGIGRDRAQEIEQRKAAKHKSLGMKVTGERISTLSALLEYKVEVLVEDLFENNPGSTEIPQPAGTRVTIYIPVREEE